MKNIIAAHICERNAVMGSVSAIIVFIIIIADMPVSRPDSLPVHLTPVVGWTSQIRERCICN